MTTATEGLLDVARRRLLAERSPDGPWVGELSSSALSTATAVGALELLRRGGVDAGRLVDGGLAWLRSHANADGGFGDTVDSPSNLSTTALAWAALGMFPADGVFARTEAWLAQRVGRLDASSLAAAIGRRYGEDRTFAVPILTFCALAGRFGEGRAAWRSIPRLPFELAALPRGWFARLGLTVVSYALPALIAIGQAQHRRAPSRNPIARLLRAAASRRTLRLLEAIQPASGGFLEAAPLTSFVAMSLAGSGLPEYPVARRAARFLAETVRPDGSWPIDTNLSTWVTTLSVQALGDALPADARRAIRAWLLAQQTKTEHPYTGAAAGGWAWTPLSGGVPDADDTPGALLALAGLKEGDDPEARAAARAAVGWLLGLQNADGGLPTFCRGWGKLPFDRSCPDLTAHALRAWHAWPDERTPAAVERALRYLDAAQRPDGAWIPLWFGNQANADETNPVYGTSRVLLCAQLHPGRPAWQKGLRWLLEAQNPDGGWGTSVEETALAVEALTAFPEARPAVDRGLARLAELTDGGTRFPAAPIGLYFARLWYSERLYPIIFTVAALRNA